MLKAQRNLCLFYVIKKITGHPEQCHAELVSVLTQDRIYWVEGKYVGVINICDPE